MEKPTIINSSALLPLSLVASIIGGVIWLTTIYERANSAFANTTMLSNKQAAFEDKISNKLSDISERLIRIEQDVHYVKEKSKKQ